MANLTLALVQMRCEKGAIDANLAAMEAYLRAAEQRGAGIACFPEASITGYVTTATHPEALVDVDGPEVARFAAMTREIQVTALAGIIERNPSGAPYITQIVARDGAVLAVYRKVTIPDEESHLYTPGSVAPPFWRHPLAPVRPARASASPLPAGSRVPAETPGFPPERSLLQEEAGQLALREGGTGAGGEELTCGTAICADISNPSVFARNATQGARLIFEAAAPGLYGEQATRDWQSGYDWWRSECYTKLGSYARELGVTIAVATQAGRTCDEDFPGGGYVFGPDGACIAESGDWSEGVLYATIEIG